MIGAVFDPAATAAHHCPGHPEGPERFARLRVPDAWARVPLRAATDAELLRVHGERHLALMTACAAAGGGQIDPDTYCTAVSEDIARRVVGALIDLAGSVWRGDFARGLALVRPPGHHAMADRAMGFCLYNGIAAATAAVRAAGARRVAILDFDAHHGNGTQDIFAADPAVLFVSSHQYPFFPGSGRATETGIGAGEGFTRNVPLPAGAGDAELLAAWRDDLLPAVRDFAPEMLLVSAGFDAHAADPLAGLAVTTAGFDALIGEILTLARECCAGRAVFVLEGGYDPVALGECVAGLVARLDSGSSRGEEPC